MTYLQFHLFFVLPPIAILATGLRRDLPVLGSRATIALFGMPLMALLFTAPWDNYLVATGVWAYGPGRVLGTIGYVPVEEYAFCLLQPLLTGLLFYRLLARGLASADFEMPPRAPRRLRMFGAAAGFGIAGSGALLLTTQSGTYMGLILVWALPVIALLWVVAAEAIARYRAAVLPAILIPTLYLWVADRTAIVNGVWEISPAATMGFAPFGLPIEEATFFLVTNVLIVFGLVALLEPGRDPPS